MSHNYNSSITLEELSPSDLYDGIIVQSFGNENCVYELNFINGSVNYTVIARRKTRQDPFIQTSSETHQYSSTVGDSHWCITTNSIMFDKTAQRNNKLTELGL